MVVNYVEFIWEAEWARQVLAGALIQQSEVPINIHSLGEIEDHEPGAKVRALDEI